MGWGASVGEMMMMCLSVFKGGDGAGRRLKERSVML